VDVKPELDEDGNVRDYKPDTDVSYKGEEREAKLIKVLAPRHTS
jgi:hypothetical protein